MTLIHVAACAGELWYAAGCEWFGMGVIKMIAIAFNINAGKFKINKEHRG